MDTLSEILRDYVNVYKSDGMTGGALDARLAAEINNGNFRSVFDKYFDTTNTNTSVLNLPIKAGERTNFVNHQKDLVTAMLAYHTSNPQTNTPAVGEPQLNAVTSTRNPNHNKYWETLAVAAKLAQGGATVPTIPTIPTIPTGTVEPILVTKIRQYLIDVRLGKTQFPVIESNDYQSIFVSSNPANDLIAFSNTLKTFIPNKRTAIAAKLFVTGGKVATVKRQKDSIKLTIQGLY